MNSIDIWNDLGNLYLKANAINAAIDAYNKAIEQGYQSVEIYKNLAGAYVSQGNFTDSIQLYQKSIELLSDDKEKAVMFTLLGDCYRRMADFDNAIAAFKTAIEIEPGNPTLCTGLSEVQRDLEKLYDFVDVSKTIDDQTLPVEFLEAPIELADDGNDHKTPVSAMLNAEKATLDPVDNLSRSNRAARFDGLDEGLQDISEFETSANPGEIDLPAGGAAPGIALDKNQASSVWVAETGDIPDHQQVHLTNDFMAGRAEGVPDDDSADDGQNLDGGENREKENGVRVTLLLTLGIMHWRNGNLEEADGILQSAINVSIKIKNSWFEALSWHALALVKTAVGDIKAAIHAYLRAVELAPEQIFPWNNLGSLYGSMGCTDKAMAAFQKAIIQHPEDSTSWDGLGDIYTRLGRIEDAISAYQLGNIFEKRPQGSDAVKAYQKAFDFYKFTIASFEKEISQTQIGVEQIKEVDAEKNILDGNPPAQMQNQTDRNPEQFKSIWMSSLDDDSNFWLMIDDQVIPNRELLTAELADEQAFQDDADLQQIAFDETQYAPDDYAFSGGQVEILSSPSLIESLPIESAGSESRQVKDDQQGVVPDFTGENQIRVAKPVLVEKNEKLADESILPVAESLPPVVSVEPAPKADPERIAGTIASYEVVVKQNPQNVRAWDSLGNLYRITQRNNDAIHAFERAVSLEPNKYVYHYQLGTLHAAEGNYADAIGEIQKVVELNPSFIFAHCALASYLRKMGQDAEAQRHIEIALPYMTNEKEYDRACFESIRGNIDRALELLTIALEKKQTTIEWIRRDLDLDFIRHDSRYKLFETRFSQSVVEY